jgi:parallel beta-helix repeat protein
LVDVGGCNITGNTLHGNNTADEPLSGGIRVSRDCLVKGNHASSNKKNNICVGSDDNVIEENLVTDSTGNGIYFSVSGNYYANNRASGNVTDYNDVPGNLGAGNISF